MSKRRSNTLSMPPSSKCADVQDPCIATIREKIRSLLGNRDINKLDDFALTCVLIVIVNHAPPEARVKMLDAEEYMEIVRESPQVAEVLRRAIRHERYWEVTDLPVLQKDDNFDQCLSNRQEHGDTFSRNDNQLEITIDTGNSQCTISFSEKF